MQSHKDLVAANSIEQRILFLRDSRVLPDSDLAILYGVTVKRLNEQVRRNRERFPNDFMFQLTDEEYERLRSHFATLKKGRGSHRKYLPYVFTQEGVAMLSSVLRSKRAIQMNIAIMRAFVRLREAMSAHAEIALKLKQLEFKADKHEKEIRGIFEIIRRLIEAPPESPKRRIGFDVRQRTHPDGDSGVLD